MYCACHVKPAAPTRAAAPSGGSVYCACNAKGSQEALCAAPATRSQPRPSVLRLPHKSQPRPSGAHTRRSSSRRLCVLRLPRERQPGSSGGFVYCACNAKGSQEALCTAPATRSQPRPIGAHARRSSVYCAYHRKASRGPPTAAHARRSSPRRLCVLRLPRERQPGSSLYCACHAKPAAPHRRHAPQLLQEVLCTAPATRKAARKLSVLRLPREASRGPAAPMRAAAPSGGSVYSFRKSEEWGMGSGM